MRRLAAVLGSVLGFAFTANGYRPLTKHGYGSAFAFGYGVFASELPMQVLGAQLTALVVVSRRLSPRIRQFSWLVLTAALDAGLGADRRTESGDLWKRPAPGGCHREETRRSTHAADLPRLRARRRHQLRGLRLQ